MYERPVDKYSNDTRTIIMKNIGYRSTPVEDTQIMDGKNIIKHAICTQRDPSIAHTVKYLYDWDIPVNDTEKLIQLLKDYFKNSNLFALWVSTKNNRYHKTDNPTAYKIPNKMLVIADKGEAGTLIVAPTMFHKK